MNQNSEVPIETYTAWIDARHPMVNRKLWGLTLLERNLRELERLGCTRVVILSTPGTDPLRHFCHPLPKTLSLTLETVAGDNPFTGLGRLLAEQAAPVVVLEGHALNDRRLLKILLTVHRDVAILPSTGIHPAGAARLSRASLPLLTENRATTVTELLKEGVAANRIESYNLNHFNPYLDNLRREVPPYLLKIENEAEFWEADNILKQTVHKGVLELVAKYIHPPLEFGMVRLIDETEITPNQITIVWLILAGLTVPLFLKGYLLLGIILAAISGVLDGVDGKLARLTLRYSKVGDRLDHVGGVIYDAIWYLALGWYFSGGEFHSTGAYFTYLLLVSYVFHRLIPGIFRAVHKREIYDFSKIDVFARLIGARMNNNVWLFLLGVLLGYPREAYYVICIWMAITAVWFILRFIWVSIHAQVVEKKFQLSS